ncbi:hypothetical protein I4U23_025074 [Adineta vaga]|nr:hypothetical protein I4U23_025074 [Adineta vaga]
MDESIQYPISSHFVRGGTSILAVNSLDNRLIAAGQQNFQLFSIKQIDHTVQFIELYDFRIAPKQSKVPWCTLQPKDVSWNRHEENSFATTSSTNGYVYIWDVTRLDTVNQLDTHSTIINRIQFHPKNPNILLTASQDGYAKLIDLRLSTPDKVASSFRHSSKEAFRDIDINPSNDEKFAAVIKDQFSVPIWDIRQPAQPDFSVFTRDRVSYVLWNPHERSWLATGGIGNHDRTIRIWDAKGNDSRQEPLYTVYTFRQVTKFSWRPTCRYHIASLTRNGDQRIHVWDIRRAYLPQASFCHHRSDIGDFLWRPNSDNLISVDRGECLTHAHYSNAVKSDQLVSLYSLNVTSNGSLYVCQPNIDNDYVRALYKKENIRLSDTSFQKLYSQKTISTFNEWNKVIEGRSILGILKDSSQDNSVQLFHQFARRWTFGNGDKSLQALEHICDMNSKIAQDLNRPDLKATWQMIKMLYPDHDTLKKRRIRSSKTSRSLTRGFRNSDSVGGGSRHHPQHQTIKTLNDIDEQLLLQEYQLNNEFKDERTIKSKEQRTLSDSKLTMVDDLDTYIVRDVLTDDIIFITPADLLANDIGFDALQDENCDIETMRTGLPLPIKSTGTPLTDNDCSYFSIDQVIRKSPEVIMSDDSDGDLKSDEEFEDIDSIMETSIHSIIPNGSDNFFTIGESYCPTIQKHVLNFDEIVRQTLWYYIENNELQMAVHLLLALYPQLSEQKRVELFNGAHIQWIVMYIELLQKMRLFVKAKQVIKHCIENENIRLHYNPTEFEDTLILRTPTPSLPRLLSAASPSTSFSTKTAQPVTREFICSICRIPCRSLFSFCGICFHGGHIEHIEAWFEKHEECSHGCGHRCRDYQSKNHPTRIAQRSISKPSLNVQK